METFLRETELLDNFDEKPAHAPPIEPSETNTELGFQDAHFVWSADDASGRAFRLKVDGTLTFKRNCLNVIVGPT